MGNFYATISRGDSDVCVATKYARLIYSINECCLILDYQISLRCFSSDITEFPAQKFTDKS